MGWEVAGGWAVYGLFTHFTGLRGTGSKRAGAAKEASLCQSVCLKVEGICTGAWIHMYECVWIIVLKLCELLCTNRQVKTGQVIGQVGHSLPSNTKSKLWFLCIVLILSPFQLPYTSPGQSILHHQPQRGGGLWNAHKTRLCSCAGSWGQLCHEGMSLWVRRGQFSQQLSSPLWLPSW